MKLNERVEGSLILPEPSVAPADPIPAPTGVGRKPQFPRDSAFRRALRARVDAYFETAGISRKANRAMWLKTATIALWAVGSWALLVFWAGSLLSAVPLALSLSLALCAVGFDIMHDGGHRAAARDERVNRAMAYALDLIGGSSFFWAPKHNYYHHTYTNLDDFDDDLDTGGLLRLAPFQERRWFHRLQVLYAWPLYCMLAIKWHLWDDFYSLATGYVGRQHVGRPRGWELVGLLAGKVFAYTWLIAIPILVRPEPFWVVLAFYGAILGAVGLIMAVIFQLAHALEDARFATTAEGLALPWAEHQLATTCDFARGSRVVTWFVGGLNFQVVHHLFPRICHVHYPRLAPIVEQVAAEHGLRYTGHRSLLGAVWAHARWLHRMGRRDEATSAA